MTDKNNGVKDVTDHEMSESEKSIDSARRSAVTKLAYSSPVLMSVLFSKNISADVPSPPPPPPVPGGGD